MTERAKNKDLARLMRLARIGLDAIETGDFDLAVMATDLMEAHIKALSEKTK